MKYKIMILVLSLTACTATFKTPQGNELSWTPYEQGHGPAHPQPRHIEQPSYVHPSLLYAPAVIAIGWMIFTYLRERNRNV